MPLDMRKLKAGLCHDVIWVRLGAWWGGPLGSEKQEVTKRDVLLGFEIT